MERFDEAERLFIEALEIFRDLLGDNHIEVARCLQRFATMRLEQTRFVAAEELYGEALAIYQASPRPNHSRIAFAQTNLAQALQGLQHWEEAERMLLAANELVAELPSTNPRLQIARKLILLYEAWHVVAPDQGYEVEAKRWRDRQANRGTATANP